MPAKQSAAGESPDGIFYARYDWLKDRLLPSAAVILLFSLILFLGFKSTHYPGDILKKFHAKSEFQKQLDALVADIQSSGEDPSFVRPTTTLFESALKTEDKDKQYKYFFQMSTNVATAYGSDHNPKLREFLESLNTFVSSNFPEKYKKTDFYTPCSDEKCGVLNYPPEIVKLKDEIQQSDLGMNKKSMLDALYNAAITDAKDKELQFAYYSFVLQLLQKEASKPNNVANNIAHNMENFLKMNFEENYRLYMQSVPTIKNL